MDETRLIERRRVPRHDLQIPSVALLPGMTNVRVREIGVAGLLLQAAEPLAVGMRGWVRMTLSGVPFNAQVEVRRVGVSRNGPRNGFEIATQFIGISPEHRQLIERFVKQ